jgi:hypothetical protein
MWCLACPRLAPDFHAQAGSSTERGGLSTGISTDLVVYPPVIHRLVWNRRAVSAWVDGRSA